MTQRIAFLALLVVVCAAGISQAALSGNLFDGNFENVAALKNNYTYDNSNNPVGAHRFNADGQDFGKWIGQWGLQDLEQNGYYGLGGFSTHDYPRDGTPTMAGVAGVVADDISNNNRSLDPYNPTSGNHIMETVAFYPTMAQWVAAPANQTTGPMQLSFDFFLNHWWTPNAASGNWDYFDRFQIEVYGSNFLPPHNVGMGTNVPGTSFNGWSPTGGATSVNTTIDGVPYRSEMLARYGWGDWWSNELGYPETNGWKSRSSASPANWTEGVDATSQGSLIIPVNLTETFDYYSVTISTGIYGEGHEYFWAVPGYGVNGYNATDLGPAIGFDNIDFRVSVGSEVILGDCNHDGHVDNDDVAPFVAVVVNGPYMAEADCNEDGLVNQDDIFPFQGILTNSPYIIKGDVNRDGLVNALDISPFVNKLTTGSFDPQADVNRDVYVNALDISGFVTCLVNGACAPAPGSAVVPEPGAGLLLVAAAMTLWRRR